MGKGRKFDPEPWRQLPGAGRCTKYTIEPEMQKPC